MFFICSITRSSGHWIGSEDFDRWTVEMFLDQSSFSSAYPKGKCFSSWFYFILFFFWFVIYFWVVDTQKCHWSCTQSDLLISLRLKLKYSWIYGVENQMKELSDGMFCVPSLKALFAFLNVRILLLIIFILMSMFNTNFLYLYCRQVYPQVLLKSEDWNWSTFDIFQLWKSLLLFYN